MDSLEEAGPSPYMLIGDPFSFPSDFLLGHVNDRVPGTVVVTLPPEVRELIGRGLHLGRVIDQYRSELERGDSSGTQTRSRGSLILLDESPNW